MNSLVIVPERYTVKDAAGRPCTLIRPPLEELRRVVDLALKGQPAFPFDLRPRQFDARRDDNHTWILGAWLTGCWIKPRSNENGRNVAAALWKLNPSALFVLVEAYLTRVDYGDGRPVTTYEQACSDGETNSPDFWACGVACKSPAGMAHDLLFDQHHAGVPDACGRYWTLPEANQAFRDIYQADDQPGGWVKWVILSLASAGYWDRKQSYGGLTAKRKT